MEQGATAPSSAREPVGKARSTSGGGPAEPSALEPCNVEPREPHLEHHRRVVDDRPRHSRQGSVARSGLHACPRLHGVLSFLVAPVWRTGQRRRAVYLPAGNWVDFWDRGQAHAGPVELVADAPLGRIPVYVLRSNTLVQMEGFLAEMFGVAVENDPLDTAMREAQEAIKQIMSGASSVDLRPQPSAVRRQQHQAVRSANLISHSYGREPQRYVRIYRE